VQAVLRTELDAPLLLFEKDAAHLGAIVLEREIDVAGLGFAAVGDFAFDPNVREILAEQIADAGSQLADGEGAPGGLEIEGELAHRDVLVGW